jgi:hypothetical protein
MIPPPVQPGPNGIRNIYDLQNMREMQMNLFRANPALAANFHALQGLPGFPGRPQLPGLRPQFSLPQLNPHNINVS